MDETTTTATQTNELTTIVKRRGRPKKIVDMKEYKKEYNKKNYEENKDQTTIKPRGRPKKIVDMKEYMKEYTKNYYKENKDTKKERYNNDLEFKQKVKETSLKNSKKYKDGYLLLKMFYELGIINVPDSYKERINELLSD